MDKNMKTNGLSRKIIKVLRLPIIILYKFGGLKIKLSSSFFVFSTIFENKRNITIGSHCNFEKDAVMRCFEDKNTRPTIAIGDNICFGNNLKILSGAPITIKSNCSIAGNVSIISENHKLDPEAKSYNDTGLDCKEINIGEGVWIGEKAIILPGVNIGDKAIIGAGSVVTHSVPSYSIACGNPARVIKKYNFETKRFEKC